MSHSTPASRAETRDGQTGLADILDLDNLAAMVAEGMIAAKTGPSGLTLYDYTQRAQFSRTWNRETMTCRGLIAQADGTVQARPFGKFFNLAEHDSPFLPDLPAEPFEVFEKLDGSLIVASQAPDGDVLLTTRGSFGSTQAVAARDIWNCLYGNLDVPAGETWCFEFLAPWNRIVVDYGEREELVFLARLDNATGRDLPTPLEWPGPVVRSFDGLTDFDAITQQLATLGPNDEGYVLRFASGMRAKAKGDEYVRLHRLLTGVNARTIWECLATGTKLDDLLDRVPDEFYAWVSKTTDDLRAQYAAIEKSAAERHVSVMDLPTRKDQALSLVDFEHKACVFRMLDGRPYDDLVWKVLRPTADRPFRVDTEAVS
jgi:RNA ligase